MALTSRREWLAAACGALYLRTVAHGIGRKDFWNTKDPAQWDESDVQRLVSQSPWARQVEGQRVKVRKGSRPRKAAPAGPSTYNGTIVWESAAPVRAVFHEALPEGFDGMYAISVSGIPTGASGAQLERMRHGTTLLLKGREPHEAAVVRQWEGNRAVLLFGFPRAALPVTKGDKEILFHTTVNGVGLHVRFSPREMHYRGQLAL